MTAIVSNRNAEAPPLTRAGLILPGLGHLVVGELVVGLGMLMVDGLLAWSALAGFGRLGELLLPGTGSSIALHPVIALLTWVVTAGLLWFTAYRRAFPRLLTEAEFNSNRAIFMRNLRAHTTGMLGMYGVVLMLLLTLLAPLIAPFDPIAVDAGPGNHAPSWAHLMGTDKFGRDVFSRLLYGGRISLTIGFVAVAIAATIGTTIGAVAAWFGGWIDRGLMWVADMLLALPRLVLLLTVVGMFRVQGTKGIYLIVVILGLTAWMGIARIVRSQVLSLKQQEFVQAARALGLSNARILFKHLIPNTMAPVIVFCSLAIGGTMLAEAGLSFLGLGVPPPISTWGVMVNDGRKPLIEAPWIATFPGLAIVIAVMSFNLFGDGLRDALDPKLRK